ncbi:hypothetical protein PA15_0301135 [Pseudomonas aeruginosa HB15]|nr:hypothetical protein PA15_0301135 [Pseudomonas aeruginosa HB15]ESR71084.1 hypothetical protein T266_10665 [Pseudomonas aeruginosa VRFPA05]
MPDDIGNRLILGCAGHHRKGHTGLVVICDGVACPAELGVFLVDHQRHLVIGRWCGEGYRQGPLRRLVEGHGQVPFAALQPGDEVVPVGVDEFHPDLQHFLTEVAAQVDEVTAVLAAAGIAHDIRRGDRGAAA